MTIHYHGTPITPRSELDRLRGRSFCVSFASPGDVRWVHQHGEGVMLDNGAYSAWKVGREVDWQAYAEWVRPWLEYQTTWCVMPDVIDGGEEENDRLLAGWWNAARLPVHQTAPVWHMDESVDRLIRLTHGWQRVCIGSSGKYSTVGSVDWHERMTVAMNAVYARAKRPWLHMLRGMALAGSDYPFASVDSTNIARNHHLDRFDIERDAYRLDAFQCPGTWVRHPEQQRLFVSQGDER